MERLVPDRSGIYPAYMEPWYTSSMPLFQSMGNTLYLHGGNCRGGCHTCKYCKNKSCKCRCQMGCNLCGNSWCDGNHGCKCTCGHQKTKYGSCYCGRCTCDEGYGIYSVNRYNMMKDSSRGNTIRMKSIHKPNNIERMNCQDPGILSKVGSKKNIPTPYLGTAGVFETLVPVRTGYNPSYSDYSVHNRHNHSKAEFESVHPRNYSFVGFVNM